MAEIISFYFSAERLENTFKYYFVSSFRHTWSLGLMTRQLRGPQQVITLEVQALPSDSCVDVWSQNISLDCLSLRIGSWRTEFLSKPSRHPVCTQKPRLGSIRCSYLCGDEEGKGQSESCLSSSRELLGGSCPSEIMQGINTCCQKSGIGKRNN